MLWFRDPYLEGECEQQLADAAMPSFSRRVIEVTDQRIQGVYEVEKRLVDAIERGWAPGHGPRELFHGRLRELVARACAEERSALHAAAERLTNRDTPPVHCHSADCGPDCPGCEGRVPARLRPRTERDEERWLRRLGEWWTRFWRQW